MATGGDTTLDPSRQSDQLRREGSLANRNRSSSPVNASRHHPEPVPNQHCRPTAPNGQTVMPLTTATIGEPVEALTVARTIRTRLLAVPARIVNRSGTLTLRAPARWPWADLFHRRLTTIRALPAPT